MGRHARNDLLVNLLKQMMKAIKEAHHIRDGDPMSICEHKGGIYMKKYHGLNAVSLSHKKPQSKTP